MVLNRAGGSGAFPSGTVLLAGGGTAGHLAPGFALKDALVSRGVPVRFVTPGEARERAWFPQDEPEPFHVAAPRLPRGALPAAAFPARMAASVHEALAMLRRTRPAAVVALGGWPCAPTAIAAIVAGVPLALVAVDAVAGVVVRRLSRFCGRVYLAFPEAVEGLSHAEVAVVVGPFLRPGLAGARRDPARFGLDPARRTLFAVGGSLGAKGLNDVVLAGLGCAVGRDPALAREVQVIHSTGPGDEARVAAAYAQLGVRAHVVPFVAAMGEALATADLVLCRGGASTLAEVAALARPAVVVPYPHHEDRQQWKNAAPLVRSGLAVVVEEAGLDPATFSREVVERLRRGGAPVDEGGGAPGAAAARGAAAAADDLVRWMEGEGRVGSSGRSSARRASLSAATSSPAGSRCS